MLSLATPRTVVYQATLSMGFPRREYWSGLPFPFSEDLPNSGIKTASQNHFSCVSCIAGRFIITWATKSIIDASLLAQVVKSLPAMEETWVWSLDLGRYPGEGNGNPLQYSCLENIPWTEEPGGLQSMGSQKVRHNWATNTFHFTFKLQKPNF